MVMRTRVYDVVTALGILVVLIWAPFYLAQDPAERALTDGETFDPPPIRDGDTVNLELVVHRENGTATTSGPVLTIRYRVPEESEIPVDAVLAEDRHWKAAAVQNQGLRYDMHELNMTHYYDEEGTVVWVRVEQNSGTTDLGPQDWDHGMLLLQGRSIAPEPGAHRLQMADPGPYPAAGTTWTYLLEHRSDGPFTYAPQSTLEAVYKYIPLGRSDESAPAPSGTEETPSDATPAGDEETDPVNDPVDEEDTAAGRETALIETSPQNETDLVEAYKHRGRVLYAQFVMDEGSRFDKTPTLPLRLGFYAPGSQFFLGFEESEPAPETWRRWTWWSPEFPTPVGGHHSFIQADGTTSLKVDIVPYEIQRGGEEIPISISWSEWNPNREPTVPLVPLRDIQNDSRPLFQNQSLADIRDLLAHRDSPEPVRTLIADGGFIATVAWSHQPGGGSKWLVRVAHDDNQTASAQIQIPSGDSNDDARIEPLCIEDDPPPFPKERLKFGPLPDLVFLCYPHGNVDWAGDRLVADPVVLSERARTEGADRNETAAFAPAGIQRREPTAGEALNDHLVPPLWDPFETNTFTRLAHGNGILLQQYDTDSGQFLRTEQHEAGDGSGLAPTEPTPATQTQAPVPLRPVDPGMAYAGIGLVVLGLLARLFTAWKSGTLIPLGAALYARVHKDQALDQKHRERIVSLIEVDPGATLMELAQRADIHRTVAYHHLKTLERTEQVELIRLGRTRHYFPVHSIDPHEHLRSAAMRHEEWARFLRIVEADPGATLKEITEKVPAKRSAVSRMGTRLAEMGLVEKKSAGNRVRFYSALQPKAQQPVGK